MPPTTLDGAPELARDQVRFRRVDRRRAESRLQDGKSQHTGRDQSGRRFGIRAAHALRQRLNEVRMQDGREDRARDRGLETSRRTGNAEKSPYAGFRFHLLTRCLQRCARSVM